MRNIFEKTVIVFAYDEKQKYVVDISMETFSFIRKNYKQMYSNQYLVA